MAKKHTTRPSYYQPQTHKHELELWKLAYRSLFAEVGNKPLVIAFSLGLRSVVDQTALLRDKYGYKVVWVSRKVRGMRFDRDHDVLAGDLGSVVKMAKMRESNENTVSILVHMAAPHGSAWRIKRMIPGSKAVCYLYDVMQLWLPRKNLHLWDQYQSAKGSNEGEYEAAEDILRGDYIEGVVYKDWGPDWPVLKDCQAPIAWCPSVHEERLMMKPPAPAVPDRFLFVGTIMPKSTHQRPAGLFADIMMEEIFANVANQGFDIHAYVLNLSKEVEEEYRKIFGAGRVKLFRGDLLTFLLPRLEGRYKWGWMLYNFPQPLVLPLIHNTLPTKLFTYMALGVPPVVSEEFTAVCNLVTKHNIGVVVKRNEHDRIEDVLKRHNHAELVKNILAIREDYTVEKYLTAMCDMVKQAMEGPTKPTPDNPRFMQLEEAFYARENQPRPYGIEAATHSWTYREGADPVGCEQEGEQRTS